MVWIKGNNGRLGLKHSAATKAKISAAHKGKPKPWVTRIQTGRKLTGQWLENVRKSRKWGLDNPVYKGDEANKDNLRRRVARVRGAPSKCAMCDTEKAWKFKWVNVSGELSNPFDYIRLCFKCVRKLQVFEKINENLG